MDADYQNLLLEIRNDILTITINRESQLNSLDRLTLAELKRVFSDEAADKHVKGVIITGSGPKAFIAGADIKEFLEINSEKGRKLAQEGHRLFDTIENYRKPVTAAINGYALGGGLELALACHIRIASEHALMGLPEINLGLIPGYGGTQRLTRLIGKGRAIEMILTAKKVSAAEAFNCGLVNYVTAQDQLIIKTEELMAKIIRGPALAIASAITAVNAATDPNKDGFSVEINEFTNCFNTQDFSEGLKAFMEKRRPDFEGK